MTTEDQNSIDLTATLGRLGLPSVIVSREGRITWMNDASRVLFGDLEGVISLEDTVAPEHAPVARREFERKLDGVPFTDYEVDVVTRDGQRVRARSAQSRFQATIPTGRCLQLPGSTGTRPVRSRQT